MICNIIVKVETLLKKKITKFMNAKSLFLKLKAERF